MAARSSAGGRSRSPSPAAPARTPVPGVSGPSEIGLKALKFAQAEANAGVKEQPPGSNSGPRVREYQAATNLGGTGWPWCAAFICWCFKQAGQALPYPSASVGLFLDWARKHSRQFGIVTRPFRGDLVCYRFDADNWPDHIGIVEKVLALPFSGRPFLIRAIEGNTSLTSQDNGGKVMRRTRWASRCSFVRVR